MGDNMPKINILVTIKNDLTDSAYTTTAIKQDSLLKYKEKDNTLVIYDYDKNSLVRENNELRMDYVFDMNKKTDGIITIKEFNKKLSVPIITNKLERKNNNIEIEFKVEDNLFLYKVEEQI